jgi:bacterioferritin (cytochrome b1)
VALGGYRAAMTDELDTEAAIERLNAALPFQQRSALHYTFAAGSLTGLELQSVTERFFAFAEAELADVRRLVEKVVALGGDPVTDVAPLGFHDGDATRMLRTLHEEEVEAVAKLQEVIPETGHTAASEALEHLIEHLLLRKQDQIDFLVRALGPS